MASLTSVMHTTPPPGLGGIADAVQAMEAGGALSRLSIKQVAQGKRGDVVLAAVRR